MDDSGVLYSQKVGSWYDRGSPPPIIKCPVCEGRAVLEFATEKFWAFYKCSNCKVGIQGRRQVKVNIKEERFWWFFVDSWKEYISYCVVEKLYNDEINWNAALDEYWRSRYDCRTEQLAAA